MKAGRLQVHISRYTMGVGILGFLWLLLSVGFWEAFLRWREISLWRDTCQRDGGTFTVTDDWIRCEYPGGGSKAMIFRKPPL